MNDPLFSSSMFDLVNPGQLLPMTGGTDLNRLSSPSTLIRSPKIRLDFGETPNLYVIKADLPGCSKIDGKSRNPNHMLWYLLPFLVKTFVQGGNELVIEGERKRTAKGKTCSAQAEASEIGVVRRGGVNRGKKGA